MDRSPGLHRLLPWAVLLALTAGAAFGTLAAVRRSVERRQGQALLLEAQRRSLEITHRTLNGQVMGAVASLGLVHSELKRVARGEAPTWDPLALDAMRAVGQAFDANGVYLVGANGVVKSCYYTLGPSLTGVDVSFRPYFRNAMLGRRSIYAAVGTTTGVRSIYFAAPLRQETSGKSPVIGAVVARQDLDEVDAALKAWNGPALLLSPQGVVFTSNREDWIGAMAGAPGAERIEEIRTLRQFGRIYDQGTPPALPLALGEDHARLGGGSYLMAQARIGWNDPNGDWQLVLLADRDALLPADQRLLLALCAGGLVLGLGAVLMYFGDRMRVAHRRRLRAEADLRENNRRLEEEAAAKTRLAEALQARESALRTSQQQIRTLVDAIPSVIFMKDLEGRHLLVNEFHEQATGIPPEQAIGRTDQEMLGGEIGARKAEQDRQVITSRRTLSFEEMVPGPDGGERYYLTTKVPLIDERGEVYGLCGSAMDMTAHKLAERDLEERMAELERFSRLTVNREERMIQLKEEINGLLDQAGKGRKYRIVE